MLAMYLLSFRERLIEAFTEGNQSLFKGFDV
jgi:hypothetical protein